MKNLAHLTREEIVQSIDGELASTEQAAIEIHLANCEECLRRYESLVEVSETLRHVVETASVSAPAQARERLAVSLEQSEGGARVRAPAPWKWAAVAAGLVILLLLIVQQRPQPPEDVGGLKATADRPVASSDRAQRHQPAVRFDASGSLSSSSPLATHRITRKTTHTVERVTTSLSPVEGAFIRLPYSDPSLPIQTSDVVHVEMRLSALANAGVIRTAPGPGDPLVRADVLLGMDGQPSAIRLVQMTAAPR